MALLGIVALVIVIGSFFARVLQEKANQGPSGHGDSSAILQSSKVEWSHHEDSPYFGISHVVEYSVSDSLDAIEAGLLSEEGAHDILELDNGGKVLLEILGNPEEKLSVRFMIIRTIGMYGDAQANEEAARIFDSIKNAHLFMQSDMTSLEVSYHSLLSVAYLSRDEVVFDLLLKILTPDEYGEVVGGHQGKEFIHIVLSNITRERYSSEQKRRVLSQFPLVISSLSTEPFHNFEVVSALIEFLIDESHLEKYSRPEVLKIESSVAAMVMAFEEYVENAHQVARVRELLEDFNEAVKAELLD